MLTKDSIVTLGDEDTRPALGSSDANGTGPGRVALDAFKLPHHGSNRNITRHLMGVISCKDYLVSTIDAGQAEHPDVEAITMVHECDTP